MRLPRFFPLYMTAAGTIPPARVLVLGAGVAGLQAIGTAKRLGARVSANDVRPASADEVALDGRHLHHPRSGGGARQPAATPRSSATTGRSASSELCSRRTSRQADVLITTAAIPGRPAPLLVTSRDGGGDARRLGGRSTSPRRCGGNVEGSWPASDVLVPTADGRAR